MHPTLRKILARDDYLCGIHVGGCRKKIDCEKDEPTIDHIWSKSYLRKHKNKTVFQKPWNYQPMCKKCNNQKGGQIVGPPQFQCRCHHIYIRPNGDMLCCYKENFRWKSVWVTNVGIVEASPERLVPTIRITSVRQHKRHIFKVGEYGHLMAGYYPFGRIITNAQQLFEVEKFQECMMECEEFKRNYEKDNGKSLKAEYGEKADNVVAGFYFLRILLNLQKEYGEGYMGVFATDFDLDKSILIRELNKEILLIDKSNYDTIFAMVVSRFQGHIEYLLNVGYLKWKRLDTS